MFSHRRKVTFIDKEGQSHIFEVADGDNLLDIAQAHDLEMEGKILWLPWEASNYSLIPIYL